MRVFLTWFEIHGGGIEGAVTCVYDAGAFGSKSPTPLLARKDLLSGRCWITVLQK